jgi:uncharacterized membrane protein YkoI
LESTNREGIMQHWRNALIALTILPLVLMIGGTRPLAAQSAAESPDTHASPGPTPGPAAEPKCWTDWSAAAAVVRRETLTSVERVSKLASEQFPGAEIIKVTLCEERGKFVYRLVLRERQGQLKSVLLNARQPDG